MSKNKDNDAKQESGNRAKKDTLNILKECELIASIDKGENLSANVVEKASCDLKVKLKSHPDILVLITSTNSFRDDRLDIANTRMRRLKKAYAEKGQKVVCIVTSNCANERTHGDDSKLLNGYNFGKREEIGLDVLVKTNNLVEVLQTMSNVQNKNNIEMMLTAAKECIEKKKY